MHLFFSSLCLSIAYNFARIAFALAPLHNSFDFFCFHGTIFLLHSFCLYVFLFRCVHSWLSSRVFKKHETYLEPRMLNFQMLYQHSVVLFTSLHSPPTIYFDSSCTHRVKFVSIQIGETRARGIRSVV
jgi:hypothetical protein